VFTEADWNHESTLERGPYRLSKRLAEERAWQLVQELGGRVELAVINPSFVVGRPSAWSPSFATSTSVLFAKNLIEGKFAVCAATPICATHTHTHQFVHLCAKPLLLELH
jgi:nucleoside-diphosphate-sugar epimerase